MTAEACLVAVDSTDVGVDEKRRTADKFDLAAVASDSERSVSECTLQLRDLDPFRGPVAQPARGDMCCMLRGAKNNITRLLYSTSVHVAGSSGPFTPAARQIARLNLATSPLLSLLHIDLSTTTGSLPAYPGVLPPLRALD